MHAPIDIASGSSLPTLNAEEPRRRTLLVTAALAFAVFSVWIHYEVKFVLPPATGTVAALGDLKIGSPAPAFSAVDLDGKAVTLESMRGQKTVLIEFWATWCPPCRMVLGTLRRMEDALKASNVEVLSVDAGEDAGVVGKFVEQEGSPFHVLLDPDSSVFAQYRVAVLPTMFLVDKQGIIRWIHIGHMPETDELRSMIDQVSKE
jgi:peroxiredoxin